MPLLDHFHPPLYGRRHWTSFHHTWAVTIAERLNEVLPPEYFAEPHVQFNIEIDVAAFEEMSAAPTAPWTPPQPAMTLPMPLVTDSVEVRVFGGPDGPSLAAALELVSPANKESPEQRDAFVSKCAAYLQQGVGLIVVDVVTNRRANLHDALLARLLNGGAPQAGGDLYAIAYRPFTRDGQSQVDIWPESLAVGGPLPRLPLCLKGAFAVQVDLGATYAAACEKLKIAVV